MIARALLVLSALVVGAQAAHAAQAIADTSDGARLFTQSCAVCHLRPSPVAKTYGPELTQDLVKGHEDAIAQIIRDGSQRMPGFQYDLQPPEIDAIVQYLAGASSQKGVVSWDNELKGDAYLSGKIA